ncbi:MAG: helix-turn-helix domain-containing protein [Candidatus Thiodiazotropha sp. (ex Monitilora ramsayi)]|nr:helix-turn-helix domain-containing protein [Candidatus Thiodiazotropha sp. (ex Monitilora ramsayi)]
MSKGNLCRICNDTDPVLTEEVECCDCGLDPMCQVLDYAQVGSGLPEGLLLRRQPVASGERLFEAGQTCDHIYAVKSGSFKSVIEEPDGRERVVGFYFAGELIGADGMAEQQYSSSVRALELSQVCQLELGRLSESGRSEERIQRALIEMLGSEVALNHLVTSSLVRQSAEQRLAAFLLSLSERLNKRGFSPATIRLRMSRSDIGSYLGVARETVSRILTKFQNEGLIRIRKNQIYLVNRSGLSDMAFSGGIR